MSSTEDYLQFAQMLANRGELNGKRLLGPKTVELMSSVFVPDTLPGRAKGRGFGLSVQVITDHIAANTPISNGSFGWDGAFGTHFWVDPKEKIVALFVVQASGPNRTMNPGFEEAVMQAGPDARTRNGIRSSLEDILHLTDLLDFYLLLAQTVRRPGVSYDPRRSAIYELPINTPVANTRTPPKPTCRAAESGGVSM